MLISLTLWPHPAVTWPQSLRVVTAPAQIVGHLVASRISTPGGVTLQKCSSTEIFDITSSSSESKWTKAWAKYTVSQLRWDWSLCGSDLTIAKRLWQTQVDWKIITLDISFVFIPAEKTSLEQNIMLWKCSLSISGESTLLKVCFYAFPLLTPCQTLSERTKFILNPVNILHKRITECS